MLRIELGHVMVAEECEMKKAHLANVFVVVFIDLLGFGLILPLLPFYAETFGGSPIVIGLLLTSYSAAQFVGAPVLGRLSDKYGRRPILLVSVFGTFVGYLVLALANGLWMLFASRIIDGITGGNISVAQSYITDVTDEKNRAKGLGVIGAAFGFGFILGPAIGGLLGTFGFAVPAIAAAALAFLNMICITFWLPESLTDATRAELAKHPRRSFAADALMQALRRPQVGALLQTRFFYGVAFVSFESSFALLTQFRLGLTPQIAGATVGLILAYVGVLAALVQGVAVGRLAVRYGEKRLIFAFMIILSISLVSWAFVPNLLLLLVVLIPLSFSVGIINTSINSALTKSVGREEIGETLGLNASLESLTRVLAPTTSLLLFEGIGPYAPGVFGALLTSWLVLYLWRRSSWKAVPSPVSTALTENHLETIP
jgi:DHA1 family tetracycline resistance protein-like MFS transporter